MELNYGSEETYLDLTKDIASITNKINTFRTYFLKQ